MNSNFLNPYTKPFSSGNFKKSNQRKQLRLFLSNISMFLLNQEKLKGLLWSIKNIDYKKNKSILKIGINSNSNKLGTILQKLRTLRKPLAEYLYQQGVTNQVLKVEFYVDREDEWLENIYKIIQQTEKTTIN